MRRVLFLVAPLLLVAVHASSSDVAARQKSRKPATENDYYRMISFPLPPDVVLEVGGLDWLDKEKTRLLACTRRGEVWRIENVYTEAPALEGKRIAVKGKDGKSAEVDPDPKQILRLTKML